MRNFTRLRYPEINNFPIVEGVCYIYTLALKSNPDTVHYVGKSPDLRDRINAHIQNATKVRNNSFHKWLGEQLDNGDDIIVDVIEACSILEWEQKEANYIKLYKAVGAPLKNKAPGGKSMAMKNKAKQPSKNKPVDAINPITGDVAYRFISMSDAAIFLNKCNKTVIKTICRVLRGERPLAYGFKWRRSLC